MVKTESFMRLQKGDAAPDFSLPGVDGRTVSLDDLRSKEGPIGKVSAPVDGFFILFMCNHCPYVKVRMGEVAALHEEFKERIAFVGINSSDPDYPGEGMENMKAFAKERGIAFPYLLDEDGSVARAYGATCTPDPFLFASTASVGTLSEPSTRLSPWRSESKGDYQLVFHGRLTDALEPDEEVKERTMRENMRKLLADELIEPWFNPSLGCSIKFKG